MIVIIMIITIIIMTIVDSLTAGEHWPKEQGSGLSASASAWWWWRWWMIFLCFLNLCTQCTGPTLCCHSLWKRAHPSVLILQHSSLAPICFFTGSIYSSPSQNKTLPPRPCSSLKYSLAWKEVYIKATVKGVKTNHKNVFKILCI